MIKGVKIVKGKERLFIAMPTYRNRERWRDVCHPIDNEFKKSLIQQLWKNMIILHQLKNMKGVMCSMKRFSVLMAAFIFLSTFGVVNVQAATFNYQLESGEDTKETFGVPITTDETSINLELENIRRNKDSSHYAPVYGIFSGEIPTEYTSPYHGNERPAYITNVTNESASVDSYYNLYDESGLLQSTSILESSDIKTEPSYYQTEGLEL